MSESTSARGHPGTLALCLATVYIVWGSSFMFTKIAVANLPIALFSAVRFMTAGLLLAAAARLFNKDPFPRRALDWRHATIAAFFMVFANNGLNAWAIQFLPSNEAALLNASAALWIAGLGVLGPRGHPLTRRAFVGLIIGFAGTALMLFPAGGVRSNDFTAQGVILAACLGFAIGTLYYRNIDTAVSPIMFMAMQLWTGGLMLLAVALAHQDFSRWSFNTPGMIALSYLTFASSCLAFSAYGWLTRNAVPALIGTYSYVNPALAAVVGWEFLHERLSYLQLAGLAVVVVGVLLVTLRGSAVTDRKTLEEPKTQ